ncbi:MAG: STAS domain-containing protein [Acidobacteriota bacterium]|nr:STAS domain-containing protein [Acidobacteriota bacterium]
MESKVGGSAFIVEVEEKVGVAVVRCHGRLVAGVGDALYSRVKQLMPEHKRIVLDLTDVAHMDSMGLGTLVRLYVSAKGAGCTLELINLGKRVRELLGMTNLLGVFTELGDKGISIRF